MFDPVPWFVGGGALHSPEIARTFAYAATSGAEGVVGAADLRVVALTTPGGSVTVLPGASLILNRSAGMAQQTYAARAGTATNVAVTAQGNSGTRYDLVVARVEDPTMPGVPWQAPSDVTVGPYVFARIIPNVDASVIASPAAAAAYLAGLGQSAIPLAGITIPANTGTITQGMLTDLRTVARPRRSRDIYNTQPTNVSSVTSPSPTYVNWTPQANRSIVVPPWATQAKIIATVSSVVPAATGTLGAFRVVIGSLVGQANSFDLSGGTRTTLVTGDTFAVPASMRGVAQTVKIEACRNSAAGALATDSWSTVILDVEFLELASTD